LIYLRFLSEDHFMSADQCDRTISRSDFRDTILRVGRTFFGLGILAIGIQHFVIADFVPVILPSFPSWLPWRSCFVWAVGAFLVIAGAAILVRRTAQIAATLLGCALIIFLVLRHIPDQLTAAPLVLGAWTNSFKILTLAGGAFVVAGTIPGDKPGPVTKWFVPFGCFTLAITVFIFGIDHFIYAKFVAPLVPAWIPGPVFWTYFCGAALMAAGLGMIIRVLPRPAAGLLGTIIFIWLIVLHIPRAIADPHSGHGNEWTSVFEALAFSGIAFILALGIPSCYRDVVDPIAQPTTI
jgi:uncharacterized membrane protein